MTDRTKTLIEVMPREFSGYLDARAYRYRDVEVVSEHGSMHDNARWPGPEKNVHYWVVLKNGIAVGWNENLSKGWGFPCKSMKGTGR